MKTKLARCWQHLQRQSARANFSAEVQKRLAQVIGEAETGHRGEIRLVVEARLPLQLIWQNVSARERALQWFSDLRVWDTEGNTGIVLYLLLAERKIELIADRGIDGKVQQEEWSEICQRLQNDLAQQNTEAGLSLALRELGKLLATHFALDSEQSNPNELTDEPVIVV